MAVVNVLPQHDSGDWIANNILSFLTNDAIRLVRIMLFALVYYLISRILTATSKHSLFRHLLRFMRPVLEPVNPNRKQDDSNDHK